MRSASSSTFAFLLVLLVLVVSGAGCARLDPCRCCPEADRDVATTAPAPRAPTAPARIAAKAPAPGRVPVTILGINDFHGRLSTGLTTGLPSAKRPVGGAAVLTAWLRAARAGREGEAFLVSSGDLVGASPAASALLQDEPTVSFVNALSRDPAWRSREDGRTNVIATLGNHEFDEGRGELMRLLRGGDHAKGPFLESPWRGAEFPCVCANVFDAATGRTLLDAYVVRPAGRGLEIGFVGAVLRGTPSIVTPTGVAGLAFRDEAASINACVRTLQARGVHAIVVLLHQGGRQDVYPGPTSATAAPATGDVLDVVTRLDDDVDVVLSAHTHTFTNALVPNAHGTPILLTQAWSGGTAFADVRLVLDAASGDVVEKTATIERTFGDEGPGLTPAEDVAALVRTAEDRVAPLVSAPIGTTAGAITRRETEAGESALGNLIADAERAALGTDFAFMNPGGIRADLDAGPVTWGELFTIQPFGNVCVTMTLTGEQVRELLEQQWGASPSEAPRILKPSGLTYTWSASAPAGHHVLEIRSAGVALDPAASYTVTCNSYLADGGDGFTVFTRGTARGGGVLDLDALVAHVKSLPQPFTAATEGRVTRVP